jgi:hypothetical protein
MRIDTTTRTMRNFMMGKFSIGVVLDTLTRSSSGNITGIIHVEADGFVFPEVEWDDFVVIILGWWLNDIIGLISGSTKNCSCQFMDGPLQFNIEVKDPKKWMIQFVIRRLKGDECLWEGTFAPQEIVVAVSSAAESVINLCRERGWASTDITSLIENHSAMNRFVRSI